MILRWVLGSAAWARSETVLGMQKLRPQPRPSESEFSFFQDSPEIHIDINIQCYSTSVAETFFDRGSRNTQKKPGYKRPLNV